MCYIKIVAQHILFYKTGYQKEDIVSQIYHIWNAEYNMVVQTFPNPYITVTSMIKIFGYKYSEA